MSLISVCVDHWNRLHQHSNLTAFLPLAIVIDKVIQSRRRRHTLAFWRWTVCKVLIRLAYRDHFHLATIGCRLQTN